MKKCFILYIGLLSIMSNQNEINAQNKWGPISGNIVTKWTKNVDHTNVLPEYPRPNMSRQEWKSLNGLWQYCLTSEKEKPTRFSKNILVPYPIESSLSGVKTAVNESQKLWYKRLFTIPRKWDGQKIILHFEAVDWETKIWVNGIFIGEHRGGYDPFNFDISKALHEDSYQEILVSVWDPTDKGSQPKGKQVQRPKGIYYTSTTGIWQSVWLEPVNHIFIEDYFVKSDIDNKAINIEVNTSDLQPGMKIELRVTQNGKFIKSYSGDLSKPITMKIDTPILWTPDYPFLYDLEIKLFANNKLYDQINGYFGMRKVSLKENKNGQVKIYLNNKFIFQNGTLDQGFWPDGIYTAPTDDALKFDIETLKKLGFNMLRKHVKVEPRRFYYWCDKLGILVWQDMPSGGDNIGPNEQDLIREPKSAKQFEKELERMIKVHLNNPSIIMWVAFNEGWGQFDTKRITDFIKDLDPSRLVSNASGWCDRGVGDIYDVHHYPNPILPSSQKSRAIVLGEFGGLGLRTEDHMWSNEFWGYASFPNSEELIRKYEEYYSSIWEYKNNSALSAVVYTQTTDVETEVNGLITYDREVIKVDQDAIKNINTNNYLSVPKIIPNGGLFNSGDKVKLVQSEKATIRYSLNGNEPNENDHIYNDEIILSSDVTLKAKAFSNGITSRTIEASFKKTDLKRPDYGSRYSKKYSAGGDFSLIDGKIGSLNFADGNWQGFEGNDCIVTIELEKPAKVENIETHFLEQTQDWIFLPLSLQLFVSQNGTNFKLLKEVSFNQPTENKEKRIKTISIKPENDIISHIKIVAKNIGTCPDWHEGKGGAAWIFIDEINVKTIE